MAEQILQGDVLNTGRIKINNAFSTQVDLWSGSTGIGSVINLGRNNQAIGRYGYVGGSANTASNDFSVILMGSGHTSSGQASVIVGGLRHKAAGDYSSVLGGLANSANTTYAGVFTGTQNIAAGANSVVLNGTGSKANGTNVVVMSINNFTGNGENIVYVGGLSIQSAVTISRNLSMVGVWTVSTPGSPVETVPCTSITSDSVVLLTGYDIPGNNSYYVRKINDGANFEISIVGGGTFSVSEKIQYLVINTH